ncbi:MAG: metalloregulator ArsR/SmtB family transcription factor [Desulfobacterales bacterium]
METFLQVMKALSDPTRVKIVKLLQHRTLCVCEIQAVLGVAQPTVSKQMKVLEEAGIVNSEKQGLWVNYSLSDGRTSPYAASILGNLRHWLEDAPEVAAAVRQLPFVDRETLCGRSPAVSPGARPTPERPLEAEKTQ